MFCNLPTTRYSPVLAVTRELFPSTLIDLSSHSPYGDSDLKSIRLSVSLALLDLFGLRSNAFFFFRLGPARENWEFE